jgi:plasmid maintenance system antidote protein VapI
MAMAKTRKLLPPVHPGEILLEDLRKHFRLSVNRLALDLHVPATRIGEMVHRRRLNQCRHGAPAGPVFQN